MAKQRGRRQQRQRRSCEAGRRAARRVAGGAAPNNAAVFEKLAVTPRTLAAATGMKSVPEKRDLGGLAEMAQSPMLCWEHFYNSVVVYVCPTCGDCLIYSRLRFTLFDQRAGSRLMPGERQPGTAWRPGMHTRPFVPSLAKSPYSPLPSAQGRLRSTATALRLPSKPRPEAKLSCW